MTYLEYIKNPASYEKMKHIEKEGGARFELNDIYSESQMQKLYEIQNLKEYIEGIQILNRDIVFRAFEEDLYKGFVYAMLWGGLGAGQGSWGNLVYPMTTPVNEMTEKLSRVNSLLAENNIKEAFVSMLRGENKIKGIGPSYFTKILYFMYGKKHKKICILLSMIDGGNIFI